MTPSATAPPAPGSAAAPAPTVWLPVQLTRFIGREREIATVHRLLGTTRLLTLTGAGGSGKTRLALEVAAQVAGEYPHGLVWIELALLHAPELIPRQIATELGIRDEGTRPPLEELLDALRERSLLLILDNCEHLIQGCARLAETLLRGAPGLRILATSREALGIAGERAWLVPALSLPGAHETQIQAVASSEAVQLFVERARDVHPAFELAGVNAAAVAEICRRLDGIPLALELAAARVKVLTPEQIAERLDDAFRLLTGGRRTAVARQQTLRAAMDWSYALLSEHEQTLLQRLSVFAGGFTIEAAEAVCVDERVEAWEVLDLLSALVDKSLVTMEVRSGEARYGLLETVRQYAAERLRGSWGAEGAQRRHAEFFLAMTGENEFSLGHAPPISWLERLEEEHDNLRAALRWLLDTGDVELATRLAGNLWLLWGMRGHMTEGRRWLRDVLGTNGSCSLPARAKAVFAAGNLARLQLDWAGAMPLLEESLAIFRQLEDQEWVARALHRLGCVATEQGDLGRAEQLLEESVALAGPENVGWRTPLLCSLGAIAEARGDLQRAATLYEQGLQLARQAGVREVAALPGSLGRIVHLQGDHRRAGALFRECLIWARDRGQVINIASALADLAGVAATEGSPDRAAHLFGAAEALFAALGTHLHSAERPVYERSLAAARACMEEESWERAWQEGYAMPLEQAIEYALGTQAEPSAMPEVAPAPAEPTPAAAAAVEAATATALRVLALGPLEIYREGERLSAEAWSYAKPRELLLYLLSHPEGRTREQIGLVFWPDSSAAQVKNNFHVTLHHLRKVLGRSEWVAYQEERYRINPELGYEFDAELFEQQMRAGLREVRTGAGSADPLRAALALYRGDFLQEEIVGDWHLEMRDQLGRLYVEGLSALGDLLMQSEQYADAAGVYQQLVRKEDLHEEAHRRLMLCLARTGERARALRHYERLVALLRAELDTEPEEETSELYERLRQAEPV